MDRVRWACEMAWQRGSCITQPQGSRTRGAIVCSKLPSNWSGSHRRATTFLWMTATLPRRSWPSCGTTFFVSTRFSAQREKQTPCSKEYRAFSTQAWELPHSTECFTMAPHSYVCHEPQWQLAWCSRCQCWSLQTWEEGALPWGLSRNDLQSLPASSALSGNGDLLAFRARSYKVLSAIWQAQSNLFPHTPKEVSSF